MPSLTKFAAKIRESRPAMALRAAAGVAGGVRQTRRGTVLVLILGALALISVVTLVYATIGQADRRLSGVRQRQDASDRTVVTIAEHLARVVGDDVTAVFIAGFVPSSPLGGAVQGDPIPRREATDYPFTDPYRISIESEPVTTYTGYSFRRFNPAGSYEDTFTNPAHRDNDPRVASDPWLASIEPFAFNWTGSAAPQPGDLRDWFQISNFAPDGRFVNLFNLRNNFDALAGFDETAFEISSRLTLLNPATGQPYATTAASRLADGTTAAQPNIPAHWTMLQAGAFRPARETERGFDDPNHSSYQWADADGDGFLDARWFEMVDAWDINNPVSLLPRDENLRWFIAARAVDLSALVNVNTGLDLNTPARDTTSSGVAPHGLVPEVDLRRLLTMQDQAYTNASNAGYQGLVPPMLTDPFYSNYDAGVALAAGEAGYNAMRAVLDINRTQVPGAGTVFSTVSLTGDQRWQYFNDLIFAGGTMAYGPMGGGAMGMRTPGPFSAADLHELLTYRGVNDPEATSRLEQTLGGRDSAQQNVSPLRDNRTAAQERPLEHRLLQAVFNPADAESQAAFNRAAFDLRHLLTTVSGARAIRSEILDWTQSGLYQLTRAELKVDARDAVDVPYNPGNTTQKPRVLFETYARALMPYAGQFESWAPRSAATPLDEARNRPLFYGRDPEVALRTAAHLTVNMLDLFDESNANNTRSYILQLTSTAPAGATLPVLDLQESITDSLATNVTDVYAPDGYITIHGIEAQPFLVQATSYGFYTSDENGRPPVQIRTAIPPASASTNSNPDYLGQILAFQLVNPFDVDLDLTGHEIEYGVASGNPGSYVPHRFNLTGTLEAGKSRVFYVTTRNIQQDWTAADPRAVVANWVSTQFSDPNNPNVQPPVEITTTSTGTQPGGVWDFFSTINPSTNNPFPAAPTSELELKARWGTVLLWSPTNTTSNTRILLDRVRDPEWKTRQTPLLLRRLVDSTQGYIEVQGGGDPGATIALNSELRRMPDPVSADDRIGGIPAYCLEGRWNDSATPPPAPTRDLRNENDARPRDLNRLNWSDFQSPYGGSSVGTVMGSGSTTPYIDEMSEHPDTWTTPASFATNFKTIPLVTGDDNSRIPFVGTTSSGGIVNNDIAPRYVEVFLDNNEFESTMPGGRVISTLRVTDMLAPLGIGPMTATNPSVVNNDPHFGHLTLSEALAIAAHMTSPSQTVSVNDPDYVFQPYREIGHPTRGALDRGHLVLEDFVPFREAASPAPDSAFGPEDTRMFPGIPMGLTVLDSFTTIPGESIRLDQFTPGLVNIQTAPLAVLRLLGQLSPTTEGNGSVWDTWKTQAGLTAGGPTVPEAPNAPGTNATHHADIPAALMAYREQTRVIDRSGRANDYRVRSVVTTPGNFPAAPTWGNDIFTGIPGLRGSLYNSANRTSTAGPSGFAAASEIMCVIRRDEPGTATELRKPIAASATSVFANGVDFLGHDQVAAAVTPNLPPFADSGTRGMLSATYTDRTTGTPVATTDKLLNNYAEKLLLASGVMNSITTRSDVYAVWFVVHGYSRSDCEDLRPTDPLIPSVAKRYLMVLDRSNVTRRGEKPRILLMTEVPLNP